MPDRRIGVPLTPVPCRGVAPMLTDLVGGPLPMAIDAVGGQMELFKGGKLRFLAVTGTQRSPLLPDLPTSRRPAYRASTWPPAGTALSCLRARRRPPWPGWRRRCPATEDTAVPAGRRRSGRVRPVDSPSGTVL
ncbi:MAG TPA: tripartite tricarboxylate transporter substrate-binding protein [Rubrivivax sp.]|nr:tripartite tricarboxylate transporter substrate-binding protein [Rubrivivax sp.]HPO19468.1 tripartite tricarboxylate transporter substrate-binding protein [Rubrivivax sp.]